MTWKLEPQQGTNRRPRCEEVRRHRSRELPTTSAPSRRPQQGSRCPRDQSLRNSPSTPVNTVLRTELWKESTFNIFQSVCCCCCCVCDEGEWGGGVPQGICALNSWPRSWFEVPRALPSPRVRRSSDMRSSR